MATKKEPPSKAKAKTPASAPAAVVEPSKTKKAPVAPMAPAATARAPAASTPAAAAKKAPPAKASAARTPAPATAPAPTASKEAPAKAPSPGVAKAGPAAKAKAKAAAPAPAPPPITPVEATAGKAAAKPAAKGKATPTPAPAVKAAPPRPVAKPAPRPRTSAPGAPLTEDELRAMPEDDYMNDEQTEFFRRRLLEMRSEVTAREVDAKERLIEREVFADPADRATAEEEHWIDLRLRERESYLLKKIDEALKRIRDKDYGWCTKTGEAIGIPRLLARPTATVCVEVKGQDEKIETHYRDR